MLVILPPQSVFRRQQIFLPVCFPTTMIAQNPTQLSICATDLADAVLMAHGDDQRVIFFDVAHGIHMAPVIGAGEALFVPIVIEAAMRDTVGIKNVESE